MPSAGHFQLNRKGEKDAQDAQQIALGRRLARFLTDHRFDVVLLQKSNSLVAVPLAERL
jgi:hypothetical protein